MKKNELTPKQEAQRTRDCAVKYGRAETYPGISAKVEGLVMEKDEKRLDQERKALWIPEEEVAAMPAWEPHLTPAVARVLGASMEQVAKFMVTISRQDKTAIVKKLTANICKIDAVLGAKCDAGLVESLVWRQLFDMLKDQGVNLKAEIKKLTA